MVSSPFRLALLLATVASPASLLACSGAEDAADPTPLLPAGTRETEGTSRDPEPPPAATAAPPDAVSPPPADDPGPAPPGCEGVTKDDDGFFTRRAGSVSYVGHVPKSYTGAPMRLFVALHGCGDSAWNFATWGASPWKTRETQDWLAISVDGASGGGNCWNMGVDAPKVLAAIDDVAKCFYVHRKKVTVGGYSSGGMLAYEVGLANASRFAGVLVECANVPGNVDAKLSAAARKLPIAHRAHSGDGNFPIASVRTTWTKLTNAGFPLEKSEIPGGHDGTSEDWSDWLLPRSAGWIAP